MADFDEYRELDAGGALAGLDLPEIATVRRLKGHASTRRFFRLGTAHGASAILVVYPESDASELLDRFARTARWFTAAGVRVSRVWQRGERALVVADGGDQMLDGTRVRDAPRLYRQALSIVAKLQAYGRRAALPNPGWALDGERFAFDVAQMLFSSFQVDTGTALLLRTLDVPPPARVLDLGCGYGPLGIVLARRFPEARVTLTDADLLAVRYARRNCTTNGVEATTEVAGGVGLHSLPEGRFELIVSNVPAKIGDEAIEQDFILGPLARLAPGGEFWFVVVSGLNRLIPKIGVRHDLDLRQMRKRSGHAVYRLRPRPA